MGFYLKNFNRINEGIVDFIDYIFSNKEEREYIKQVPYYCRNKCELLKECRNAKNKWKCYKGCLRMPPKKKEVKYHKNGLPIETRYNEEDYKYYR